MIMGAIIGTVIFQKFSHAVAPSIADASYREDDMLCSAARKMIVWIPVCHNRSKMLL